MPDTRRRPRGAGRAAAASPTDEAALRRTIDAYLVSGRAGDAASFVLSALGAELFGVLTVVLDDRLATRVVYGAISDALGREIDSFAWRCSLRIWAYAVARRELARLRSNREAPRTPVSVPSPRRPFSGTPYRSTFTSSLAARLRDGLSTEDRELLVLRVDRGFTWAELAVMSLGERASPRRAATEAEDLRARFARIRAKIARRAARHGVVVR